MTLNVQGWYVGDDVMTRSEKEGIIVSIDETANTAVVETNDTIEEIVVPLHEMTRIQPSYMQKLIY